MTDVRIWRVVTSQESSVHLLVDNREYVLEWNSLKKHNHRDKALVIPSDAKWKSLAALHRRMAIEEMMGHPIGQEPRLEEGAPDLSPSVLEKDTQA